MAEEFDPQAILEVLERHRVSYVLIGGIAAVTRGAQLLTEDVDITPARDAENLGRLAGARRELGASIRIDEPHRNSCRDRQRFEPVVPRAAAIRSRLPALSDQDCAGARTSRSCRAQRRCHQPRRTP